MQCEFFGASRLFHVVNDLGDHLRVPYGDSMSVFSYVLAKIHC